MVFNVAFRLSSSKVGDSLNATLCIQINVIKIGGIIISALSGFLVHHQIVLADFRCGRFKFGPTPCKNERRVRREKAASETVAGSAIISLGKQG